MNILQDLSATSQLTYLLLAQNDSIATRPRKALIHSASDNLNQSASLIDDRELFISFGHQHETMTPLKPPRWIDVQLILVVFLICCGISVSRQKRMQQKRERQYNWFQRVLARFGVRY